MKPPEIKMVHFWCTFGAVLPKNAPKVHHPWYTFGGVLGKTAPKVHHYLPLNYSMSQHKERSAKVKCMEASQNYIGMFPGGLFIWEPSLHLMRLWGLDDGMYMLVVWQSLASILLPCLLDTTPSPRTWRPTNRSRRRNEAKEMDTKQRKRQVPHAKELSIKINQSRPRGID